MLSSATCCCHSRGIGVHYYPKYLCHKAKFNSKHDIIDSIFRSPSTKRFNPFFQRDPRLEYYSEVIQRRNFIQTTLLKAFSVTFCDDCGRWYGSANTDVAALLWQELRDVTVDIPNQETWPLASIFILDEVRLQPDRLANVADHHLSEVDIEILG